MVQIASFIKRKNIKNQSELAKLLGTTQGTVSAWATGTSNPTHEMEIKLLKLGMSIRELFGEDFPIDTITQDEAFDNRVYRSIARLVDNLRTTPTKEYP